MNRSFMIGDAIKVFPALSEQETTIKAYFPDDYWVDLNTFEVTASKGSGGSEKSLPASWEYVNVHLRGGKIIPWQDVVKDDINTTAELISFGTILLYVHPDENQQADGTLYIDNDGISQTDYDNGNYQYYKLEWNKNTLRFLMQLGNSEKEEFTQNEVLDEKNKIIT